MDDLISVVVPVYNVEFFLERCIISILKQSYKNIEVILSDDGSTDKSSDICDAYAKTDFRIKVLHEKNKGLSEARNRGIKMAKGKYLCFVDSDDWIDQDYILKLYYAIMKTNSDISECKYKITSTYMEKGKKGGLIKSLESKNALVLLCENNYEKHIVAWNKLYKKELFENICYPIGKLHEDEYTTHKLYAKAKKIAFIDDELYFYYTNPLSITKSKITNNRIDAIDAFVERIYFFRNLSLSDLADKTSVLLFRLFADFASLPKEQFENYDEFINKLNHKYFIFTNLIDKKRLGIFNKFYFKYSRKDVRKLRNNNKCDYYLKRFEQKIGILLYFFTKKQKSQIFKNIKDRIKEKRIVAFILASVEYRNFGDLAIGEAMYQYISEKYKVIEIPQKYINKSLKCIQKVIRENDIICLPGGGNVGDVWKTDEDLRRSVISSFPNNKIIIFPQSISYQNINCDYFKDSKYIYQNHKNLYLCLRDEESLKKANLYYPLLNTILVPDSVFLLKSAFDRKELSDNVALCFREDRELMKDSLYTEINIIKQLYASNIPFDSITTLENGSINLEGRKKAVYEKINEVSKYRLVITDRLHCIIFCALSGTPCIALNNSNNKIKNFIDTWLPNQNLVHYLDNNDKIDSSIFNVPNDCVGIKRISLKDKFKELDIILNE